MGYDSKKPIENPTDLEKIHEKIFDSIIGKAFSAAITPDGSVLSVTGMGIVKMEFCERVSTMFYKIATV